jgi:hypothetical protein
MLLKERQNNVTNLATDFFKAPASVNDAKSFRVFVSKGQISLAYFAVKDNIFFLKATFLDCKIKGQVSGARP